MKGLLTYLHTLSIKGFTQLIQKFDICSKGFAQLVQNSNNRRSHKGIANSVNTNTFRGSLSRILAKFREQFSA